MHLLPPIVVAGDALQAAQKQDGRDELVELISQENHVKT